MQDMHMDFDQVVDVPDTPDRLASRNGQTGESFERESNSSFNGHLVNPHFLNEGVVNGSRSRGKLLTENEHNRRLLFRSPKNNSNFNEFKHPIRAQQVDKQKDQCSKLPSISYNPVLDLSEQNGILSEELGKGSIDSSRRHSKGKEKADESSGKEINVYSESQPKMEKIMSASFHSIRSPHNGRKRLVRNGCISPLNIAKAKGLAYNHCNSEKNDISNVGSESPSCLPNIKEIISEDNTSDEIRGKGVMMRPCSSGKHDARTIDLSSSVPNFDDSKSKLTSDAFESFEGYGGWRSTRNRSKRIPLTHENRLQKVNSGSARSENQIPPPSGKASSSTVSETLIKRQRKHPSHISGYSDSEIVCLGSSNEPSSSRSRRNQIRHCGPILDQVIELDESSPISNNDDSDARARQLEADEILALELQEQLYHEVPVLGNSETDAHIAWSLQAEENARHNSYSRGRPVSYPRASVMPRVQRQGQSQTGLNHLVQRVNPSVRRVNPPVRATRAPGSSRMSRLRGRFLGDSPTVPTTGNFVFPQHMDLDMRMHILEALEAAIGDDSEMGTASRILQVQREFTENDYEMLLALDENNQSTGASVNQINNLPQSTMQTDNFEEACTICLEIPTIGDTIRHLPCLHKFHKECIDSWLVRKSLCPICKSSIT